MKAAPGQLVSYSDDQQEISLKNRMPAHTQGRLVMSEQSLNENESSPGAWPRTSWSRLDLLGADPEDRSQEIYEELISRYWPAVYSYIRRTGRSSDEASDLTQGFICDVVLGRQLFHAANRDRGRFRSLLLTALKNYIVERHRYETRIRRGGRAVLLSFDLAEQNTIPSRDSTSADQPSKLSGLDLLFVTYLISVSNLVAKMVLIVIGKSLRLVSCDRL